MERTPLGEVLARHARRLMDLPGVVGTAEGRTPAGEPCILLLLAAQPDPRAASFPETIETYPVRVRVTGSLDPRAGA